VLQCKIRLCMTVFPGEPCAGEVSIFGWSTDWIGCEGPTLAWQGEGEVKIMSRLLHPWAAVTPGDTHALIADDSDCLLMAAMAAGREAQSLFVLAEPQLGRGIAFGPDGLPQMRGAAAAGAGARPGSRGMASAASSSGSLSSAPSSSSSALGDVLDDGEGAEGAAVGAAAAGQAAPAGAGAPGGGAAARPAAPAAAGAPVPGARGRRTVPYNCFSVDALRELWTRELPFLAGAGRAVRAARRARGAWRLPLAHGCQSARGCCPSWGGAATVIAYVRVCWTCNLQQVWQFLW
jgi:hypothetical protein